MADGDNEYEPTVLDLSSVSQLPEAQGGEITENAFLYASVPSQQGDPQYESRKVTYG